MALKRLLIAIAAIAVGLTCSQKAALAQNSEPQLAQGMRNIAAAWQQALTLPLVFTCPENTFGAIRAYPGSRVTGVDLRRTNSIMNPYQGVVAITGVFETNLHGPDACYETKAAARGTTDYDYSSKKPSMIYEFQVYYTVDSGKLVMTGGNTVFLNNFLRREGQRALPEPGSPWDRVYRQPLN